MTRAPILLAALLLAAAALVSADCTLDAWCADGTPGCAADPCHDHLRDGDETDLDCGGSCGPCAPGAGCAVPADCGEDRCFEGACCAPPCVVWARRDGGDGSDVAWGAAALPDGTVVTAGEMHGTVDFGGGPLTAAGGTDVFVTARAPGGALRWARRLGGSGEETFPRLAVTRDGRILLAGAFQSPTLDTGAGVLEGVQGAASLFVLALSASGETLAARAIPGAGASGGVKTIAAAADGGAVLTGQLGSFDFGDGAVLASPNADFDIFVARLGPDLATVWSFALGDAGDDWIRGAALDAAGDLVITATSTSNTSYGGPPVAGPGLALAKYDGETGAHVWSRSYGENLTSFDVTAAPDGSIAVVGDLTAPADLGTGKLVPRGLVDAFVARFDATGTPTRVTQITSSSETYGLAVAPDAQGGLVAALRLTGTLRVVGGQTVSGPTGVDSVLLLGLDADGGPSWAKDVGGVVLDHTAVLLSGAPEGHLLLHGGFAGTLDLGGPLTSAGGSDAFVTEILP